MLVAKEKCVVNVKFRAAYPPARQAETQAPYICKALTTKPLQIYLKLYPVRTPGALIALIPLKLFRLRGAGVPGQKDRH
jgi:hypothetical protein